MTRQVYAPVEPGQKFGTWTAVEAVPAQFFQSKKDRYWRCTCDCGATRSLAERNLRNVPESGCAACRAKSRFNLR